MRYLVLSDLHSNQEATSAVLDAARSLALDHTVVLGDLVGYGASPNEVVEAVRDLNPLAIIRGNHDKVVSGLDPGEEFNRVAMQAARINRNLLSKRSLEYLRSLPRGPVEVTGRFAISHGTPLDEDEYLVDERDAAEAFRTGDFSVCFFGHTHLPGVFVLQRGIVTLLLPRKPEAILTLEPGARYLINPGSVGQPRDQDPRAAYAWFDDAAREVVFRRVEYPVSLARDRIREAGLPEILGERLQRGV